MESSDLVTIYSVNHAMEAEIVKNALQTEGIRCFLEGTNEASSVGLVPEVKVQVAARDADRARKVVEAHEGTRHATKQTWANAR